MTTLTILTWNIWIMPPLLHLSPSNGARAQVIGELLASLNVDILCLMKAFDDDALDTIVGLLRPHGYRLTGPANPGDLTHLHSGVCVLSKLAVQERHEIVFRDHVGIESFARKGAMLRTMSAGDQRFRLIATHLQGDDSAGFVPEKQRVRDRQVEQIRNELIDPLVPFETPLIVCGDFCTPRFSSTDRTQETSHHQHILSTLGVRNEGPERITLDDRRSHNDLADDDSGRIDELDYIFTHAGDADMTVARERVILRRSWEGAGRKDLSYRYAVGATITFKP